MNAATRMRASWRVRCAGGDAWSAGGVLGGVPSGVLCGVLCGVLGGAGVRVVAVGVWEDAAADMIPIKYVTDRFGFLEGRTG
jgi:hypothetical protein